MNQCRQVSMAWCGWAEHGTMWVGACAFAVEARPGRRAVLSCCLQSPLHEDRLPVSPSSTLWIRGHLAATISTVLAMLPPKHIPVKVHKLHSHVLLLQ